MRYSGPVSNLLLSRGFAHLQPSLSFRVLFCFEITCRTPGPTTSCLSESHVPMAAVPGHLIAVSEERELLNSKKYSKNPFSPSKAAFYPFKPATFY